MKQSIRVKPLKKYTQPKYPCVGDVAAIELLKEQPYPFRSQFKSYVATIGLSTVFTQLCFAGAQTTSNQNPFTVSESGLPHQTSPYGTGMPSYLSEESARKIIEKVFSEHGFQLQNNVPYQMDDISFVADGYDTERKIGYVWGDWDSLDHRDAIKSWSKPNLSADNIDRIVKDYEQDRARDVYIINRAKQYIERHNSFKTVQDQYQEALEVEGLRAQLSAFAAILDQLEAPEDPKRISIREATLLEDQALEDKNFIALISGFDRRFQYNAWNTQLTDKQQDQMAKLRQKLDKTESEEERRSLYIQMEEIHAEKALQELEDAVRSYIEWAQTQGL